MCSNQDGNISTDIWVHINYLTASKGSSLEIFGDIGKDVYFTLQLLSPQEEEEKVEGLCGWGVGNTTETN
ncbi:hypothetical protein ACTXT7_004117 [Hymenolepis weldensis]